ncbi:MAG: Gfo/Idh/MocA family oxidoreductase [Acidobacteriota bacterium]|nr:Gfo/Idh/MocA family oxidoreductase [Acidobacteriota bacterium]
MFKKTLNWAVLGVGQISEVVAPAIRDSDWAVPYAIASRTLHKADGFARRHGFTRSYGCYEAVLEDPAVDVVYNPLPNWLHCDWTVRALEAGKHVLCEKPLAEDMAECRRMVAVSRQCGRSLMEAFAYRFHPQTARVKELVSQGRVGELRLIRSSLGFPLDFSRPNVRLKPSPGGGALMDVGCYCIHAMRYLTDEEPQTVLGRSQGVPESGVDLTFGGMLIFPGGCLGLFSGSFRTAPDFHLEIVGSRGRLLVPSPFKPDPSRSVLRLEVEGEARDLPIRNGGNMYRLQVDHFSRSVLDGRPLSLPFEDALGNMAVIEALRSSARTGRETPMGEGS